MAVSGEDLGRFFQTHNARFGKCLEPSMNCPRAPIRAHSIQNARVIDLLAENSHVIALRPDFSDGIPKVKFKSIGRNKASTFTGLCGEHDRSLFAPLDNKPLDIDDREQLFLLAYRSVTRELHTVMEGAAKIQSAYSSRVKRGLDPANNPSPAGILATQQLLNSYFTYLYRSQNFDEALRTRQFDMVEHDVIRLDQPPTLAVSSLFSLDEILKDDDIVRVVLNVLPVTDSKTLAIFSYSKEDRAKARSILNRIFVAQGEYQKYELSKRILESIENFLIAPSHFRTWSTEKQERIRIAFASTIMAGTAPAEHADLMLF